MICSQIKVKSYDDFYLTNYNTLRIKAKAKKLYLPDNYGEMISLLKKYKDDMPIVIGNGSNILFSSQKIENPIIHTGSIKNISVVTETFEIEADSIEEEKQKKLENMKVQ